MNIGNGIKNIRKIRGISQGDLAERINISPSSLSQIENGIKRPTAKNLKKICDALNVPEALIQLYTLDESDVPESKKEIYRLFFPTIKEMMEKIIQ